VLYQLAVFRKVQALEDRPWVEVRAHWDDQDVTFAKHANPVVGMLMPGLTSCGKVIRERLAQIRLLRAAALVLAGAELPEIPDPFGTAIRRDASRVWSLGPDGVDGGGVGAWKSAKTGDLVVELRMP